MVKFLSSMIRFLSSIKLAVFLIAAIAVMSMLATVYSEVDFYGSWSFKGVMVAFTINLLLCTIKILPKLWTNLKRQAKDLGDVAQGEQWHDLACTEEEMMSYLRQNRYKITTHQTEDHQKILGKKGIIGLLAPHVLHVSILTIMVGCFLVSGSVSGGVFGYIGQSSPLPGDVREVIGESQLEVVNFETVFDEAGHVDNWVTTFNLTIEGVKVVELGETKVNAPYKYGDMVIYQNSYGNQHLVEIVGEEGGAYSLNDDWHFAIRDREFMVKQLDDGRVLMKVYKDEEVLSGQIVNIGDVIQVFPDTTIEYLGPNPYTVLEVKVSPGTNVVFAGFILATIASMMFWSGRYRELRILINRQDKGVKVCCFSKNKVIADEVIEQLSNQYSGGR